MEVELSVLMSSREFLVNMTSAMLRIRPVLY